jgi:2-polyprenyl-3-methyl-5-hydroxy-6-metoxy-1,4-benzoquinol methylase
MNHTAEAPAQFNSYDANASFWVQIIREHRDKYRNELTDPAMLQAIGDPRGLDVLDAGCAEGYLSRILAGQGAVVRGIDSSQKLIEAANQANEEGKLPASFDVGSVDDLPYRNDTFDLVVANHLINDLHDPGPAISEFARVLRPGGRLIILMLHPCFYNKHTERHEADNSAIAASYFDVRSLEQPFKVDGLTSPATNTAWFRPLEYYTEQLHKTGFSITSLTEPHPSPDQVKANDWWRTGFRRPLFILLVNEFH